MTLETIWHTLATSADPAPALVGMLEVAARAAGAAGGAVLGADGTVHAARDWPGADDPGARPADALRVPLQSRGARVGELVLRAPQRAGEAASALAYLAPLAALVLENVRLEEEARVAAERQDHFLTALHHELRTPATGLVLQAELLRDGVWGDVPPRTAEALRKAGACVEEVVGVLERVRELGALAEPLPAGAAEELVDVRRLAGDLLRRVEPAARRKELRLVLRSPRDLPLLQTDRGRLSRILLHLLGNAVRFTDTGEVEVRLSQVHLPRGHRRDPAFCAEVTDTGRGIPRAELERVFEPFAQVDEGARTDSRSRGVGLGLPLARRMARSLGGELTLESREGEGTRATLVVPYRRPA